MGKTDNTPRNRLSLRLNWDVLYELRGMWEVACRDVDGFYSFNRFLLDILDNFKDTARGRELYIAHREEVERKKKELARRRTEEARNFDSSGWGDFG